MVEFLGEVLEKGGVVAVLYVLTLLAGGVVFRWLVKKLRESEIGRLTAEAKIEAVRSDEKATRAEMRLAHEEQIHRINQAHAEEIAALREEQKEDANTYAEQLHSLQERRVEEGRAIVREVVQQTTATEAAMTKLGEILLDVRSVIRGAP